MNMETFPRIRGALDCYSVQLGLERPAADALLRRQMAVETWRVEFLLELRRIQEYGAVDWMDLVANDSYEVDDPENEAEARKIVLGLLWPVAFPDEPVPSQEEREPKESDPT